MAHAVMDAHFEQERIKALRQQGRETKEIEKRVMQDGKAAAADIAARREAMTAQIKAGSPQ